MTRAKPPVRQTAEPTLRPSTSPLLRFGSPWLIVAAVAFAFGPALGAHFVNWDDDHNLTENYAFRGLDAEHLSWMFTTNWMGPYQPLAWLSLALDHAFTRLDASGGALQAARFHQTSVAIHAATAIAFYFLAWRCIGAIWPGARAERPNASRAAALFAALAFAVHPLRVESVAWVTERRDVLCGFFFVLALLGYVRANARASEVRVASTWRSAAVALAALGVWAFFESVDLGAVERLRFGPWGAMGLALAVASLIASASASVLAVRRDGARASIAISLASWCAFVAACASKGTAVVLPLLLLVFDLWPLARSRVQLAFGAREARVAPARAFAELVLEKSAWFAVAAIFGVIAIWGQRSTPGTLATFAQHPLGARVVQSLYGLAFYPWKTVLPIGLSPLYALPEPVSLSTARFAVAALAVVAGYALLVRFHRRIPGVVAAFAAYALAIAPVLGLTQAGPQLVADRYSYLACMPLALAFGGAAYLAFSGPWRVPATLGGSIALVACASASRELTEIWTGSERLWARALSIEPESPLALLNLAYARIDQASSARGSNEKRALLSDARQLLERGLADRRRPLLVQGLAKVHGALWQLEPNSPEHHDRAAVELMKEVDAATRADGTWTPVVELDLGSALCNAGDVDAGLKELEAFIALRPDHFLGRFNLGYTYLHARRYADAVRELERAVQLEPDSVDAWGNLGQAYENAGERARAIEAYSRVLALQPGHIAATARLKALGAAK